MAAEQVWSHSALSAARVSVSPSVRVRPLWLERDSAQSCPVLAIAPDFSTLRFSHEQAGPDIHLNTSGLIARMAASERQLVRLNQSYASGVHYWEFICPVSCANLEFGVVQTGSETTFVKFKNSTPRVVGVQLNMYTQRLAFYLNGRLQDKKILTLWPGTWRPAVWMTEKDTTIILNPYCQGLDCPYLHYVHHSDWTYRLQPWVCMILPTPTCFGTVLKKIKAEEPVESLHAEEEQSGCFLFRPRETLEELIGKVRSSGENCELFSGSTVAVWMTGVHFSLERREIEDTKRLISTHIDRLPSVSLTNSDFKSSLLSSKSPKITLENPAISQILTLHYIPASKRLLAVYNDQFTLVPLQGGQFHVSSLLFTEPQTRQSVIYLHVTEQEIVNLSEVMLTKIEELGLSSEALDVFRAMENLVKVENGVYLKGQYEGLVRGVMNVMSGLQVGFQGEKDWMQSGKREVKQAVATLLRLEEELRVRQPVDCGDLWPPRTSRLHTSISRLTSHMTSPDSATLSQLGVINTKDWFTSYVHFHHPTALLSDLKDMDKQLPGSEMLQGRYTVNVPLSVSVAIPAKRHPGLRDVMVEKSVVMSFGGEGSVKLWDTTVYLVELASVDMTVIGESVEELVQGMDRETLLDQQAILHIFLEDEGEPALPVEPPVTETRRMSSPPLISVFTSIPAYPESPFLIASVSETGQLVLKHLGFTEDYLSQILISTRLESGSHSLLTGNWLETPEDTWKHLTAYELALRVLIPTSQGVNPVSLWTVISSQDLQIPVSKVISMTFSPVTDSQFVVYVLGLENDVEKLCEVTIVLAKTGQSVKMTSIVQTVLELQGMAGARALAVTESYICMAIDRIVRVWDRKNTLNMTDHQFPGQISVLKYQEKDKLEVLIEDSIQTLDLTPSSESNEAISELTPSKFQLLTEEMTLQTKSLIPLQCENWLEDGCDFPIVLSGTESVEFLTTDETCQFDVKLFSSYSESPSLSIPEISASMSNPLCLMVYSHTGGCYKEGHHPSSLLTNDAQAFTSIYPAPTFTFRHMQDVAFVPVSFTVKSNVTPEAGQPVGQGLIFTSNYPSSFSDTSSFDSFHYSDFTSFISSKLHKNQAIEDWEPIGAFQFDDTDTATGFFAIQRECKYIFLKPTDLRSNSNKKFKDSQLEIVYFAVAGVENKQEKIVKKNKLESRVLVEKMGRENWELVAENDNFVTIPSKTKIMKITNLTGLEIEKNAKMRVSVVNRDEKYEYFSISGFGFRSKTVKKDVKSAVKDAIKVVIEGEKEDLVRAAGVFLCHYVSLVSDLVELKRCLPVSVLFSRTLQFPQLCHICDLLWSLETQCEVALSLLPTLEDFSPTDSSLSHFFTVLSTAGPSIHPSLLSKLQSLSPLSDSLRPIDLPKYQSTCLSSDLNPFETCSLSDSYRPQPLYQQVVLTWNESTDKLVVKLGRVCKVNKLLVVLKKGKDETENVKCKIDIIHKSQTVSSYTCDELFYRYLTKTTQPLGLSIDLIASEFTVQLSYFLFPSKKPLESEFFVYLFSFGESLEREKVVEIPAGYKSNEKITVCNGWSQVEYSYDKDMVVCVCAGKTLSTAQLMLNLGKKQGEMRTLLAKVKPEIAAVEAVAGEIAEIQEELTVSGVRPTKSYQLITNLASSLAHFLVRSSCRLSLTLPTLEALFPSFIVHGPCKVRDNVLELLGLLLSHCDGGSRLEFISVLVKRYIQPGAVDCVAAAHGVSQGLQFFRAPAGLILRLLASNTLPDSLAFSTFLALCLYTLQRATVEEQELQLGFTDLLSLIPAYNTPEILSKALELISQYQLLLPTDTFETAIQSQSDTLISVASSRPDQLLPVLNRSKTLCERLVISLIEAVTQSNSLQISQLLKVYQQLTTRPELEKVVLTVSKLLENRGNSMEIWKLGLVILREYENKGAILAHLIPNFLAEPEDLQDALSADLLEVCKSLPGPALFTLMLDVSQSDSTSTLAKGWVELLLQTSEIPLLAEDISRAVSHIAEILSGTGIVSSVEAASAVSMNTVQRMEFLETEVRVVLRHLPGDIGDVQVELGSLERIIEWVLLGMTKEEAEKEDGFPTYQTIRQLTRGLFTLLSRLSSVISEPLLCSCVSLVRLHSSNLLHQVHTHHFLSVPSLSTATRLMSNFLTLTDLALTSDSLASYFAFQAQGFAMIMESLMTQSQEQTTPLEDEEFASKMMMVNLPGMTFAGNTAGTDWSTYKKGNRNKLFTREFTGKEKHEIVLAFDLQKEVELRHVSVGFNLFSTEAADRVYGLPVTVLLEGGDSLDTLHPLGKLHPVPDFAYSHFAVGVCAHNFADGPFPVSHKVRFICLRLRRPVFSCIESSTLLLKKCTKVEMSISFISIMGYDMSVIEDVPLLMAGVFKLYALKLFSRISKPEYVNTMSVIANEPQVLAQLQASFEMLAELLHLHESWLALVLSQLSKANTEMADWLLDNLLRLTRGPEHARLVNDIIQSDPSLVQSRLTRLSNFVLHSIQHLNLSSTADLSSRYASLITFIDVLSSITANLTTVNVRLQLPYTHFLQILTAIRLNLETPEHSKSLSRLLLSLIYPQTKLQIELDFNPEIAFFETVLTETIEKTEKTGFEEALKCIVAYSNTAASWLISNGTLGKLLQDIETEKDDLKVEKLMDLICAFAGNERIQSELCEWNWPERLYNRLKISKPGSNFLEKGVKTLIRLVLNRTQEEKRLASELTRDISEFQSNGLIQSLLVPLLSSEFKISLFLHLFDPYSNRWISSLTSKTETSSEPSVPFIAQTCSSFQMMEVTKSLKAVAMGSEERKGLLSANWTQVFYLEHTPDCSTWLAFHRALEQRAPVVLLFQAESRGRGDVNVAIASFKPVPQVPDVLEDEVTAAIPFDKDNFILYMEDTHVYHFESAGVPQRNFGEVLCDYEGGGALNLGGEFLWLSFSYDYSTCIDHAGFLTCREKGCVLPGEIKVKSLEVWTCQLQEDRKASQSNDFASKYEDSGHPFALLQAAPLLSVPALMTAEALSHSLFQGWVKLSVRGTGRTLQREDVIQNITGNSPVLSLEYRLNQRKESLSVALPSFSRYPLFEYFQAEGGIAATLAFAQQSLTPGSGWTQWLQEIQTFFQVPGFFSAFIRSEVCKELLFAVLSGAAQGKDEAGAIVETYKTLAELLKLDQQEPLRLKAVEVGLIECILSRLDAVGKAQKPAPPQPSDSDSSSGSHYSDDVSDNSSEKKVKEGTGYAPDHTGAASRWDVGSYLQSKQTQTEQKAVLVEVLISFLSPPTWTLPSSLVTQLLHSPLSGFLEQYLGADSLLEVDKEKELFSTFLRLVRVIAGHSQLNALVEPALPRLKRLADLARTFFRCLQNVETNEKHHEILAREILDTEESIAQFPLISNALNSYEDVLSQSIDVAYPLLLENLRLDYMNMKGENGAYQHFYNSQLTRTSASPPPEKMYRLAREIADLSHSLPISHTNSIFVRVDTERADLLKAIVMGASETPYAHGAFEFDIFLEDSYPNSPPKVNLMTTGGEQVRFNPNLYNCGKVCLSLLGTWRGYATENWDPKISTLLQVLMSIQSMIMTDDVYFNEPGFEQEANTDEGSKKNEAYCNIIRYANAKYAMLDQIRKPPKGFETVIRRHFYLKKEEIIADLGKWLKDAKKKEAIYSGLVLDHNATFAGWFRESKEAYYEKLLEVVSELEEELGNLPEPIPEKTHISQEKPHFSPKVTLQEGKEIRTFTEIDVSDDVVQTRKTLDVGNRAVTDRLSRYIGAMGLEAVKLQAESAVLVFGAGCLAVEIAKNVVLSGIKRLTIVEKGRIIADWMDIGGNCMLRAGDVGRHRAEAVASRLQQLNTYAVVDWKEEVELEEIVREYRTVVVTEKPWQDFASEELELRNRGVNVVSADAYGLFGRVFVDFGDQFSVSDVSGEELQDYVIASVSNDTVTLLSKHNLEDGSLVNFSSLDSLPTLNNTTHPVTVLNSKTFRLPDSTYCGQYTGTGVVSPLPKSATYHFHPLASNLPNPTFDPTYLLSDFSKMHEYLPQHIAMLAFDIVKSREIPPKQALLDAISNMECGNIHTELTEHIFSALIRMNKGTFPPICSYLGGVAAQEVIKSLTRKFTPVKQLIYYNLRELGRENEEGEIKNPVEICMNRELIEALAGANVFMVGVGAIGCELLKNLSLLGVSTSGKMTITDPDLIENSNLSRQFLFREKHIRLAKAAVAAAAAVDLNSALTGHMVARLDKVYEGTRHVFSGEFFREQTVVLTALDNLQARRYVDGLCIEAKRPLLDSGTLGSKGHVQVVLPDLTETYGERNDPEDDQSIPVCTLKLFPEETTHCIEWALDLFAKLFTAEPALIRSLFQKKDTVLEGEKLTTAVKILRKWPNSFEDCVHFAWRKFHQLFNISAQRLMQVYPLDAKTSDGKPFWTLPKRPPVSIPFDASNPNHVSFILSTSLLQARVCSVQVPSIPTSELQTRVIDMVRSFPVKEFRLSKEKEDSLRAQVDSKDTSPNTPSISTNLQSELNALIGSVSLDSRPEEFEKDNDGNGHVDFIHAACNCRAQVYTLKSAEWITVKLKAGRIIPAMATTTAVVAALQTVEMVKVVKRCMVDVHRNAFINLAASVCAMTEPSPPRVLYTLPTSGPVTAWTHWEVPSHLTLHELFTHFHDKYDIHTQDVLQASKPIYLHSLMTLPGKEMEREATLRTKLRDLVGDRNDDIRLLFTVNEDEKLLQSPPIRLTL